jgi:predicted transposase
MNQVLTLVVKLQASIEQQQLLSETAYAFATACNWINQNVNPNLTNKNSIQAVCYKDVKDQFGLTANHVVRACARVGANRLTAKQKNKKVKGFKPTSFDCDARTFRFIESDWTVSISTTGKRLIASLRASNYHQGKLTGQNPTSAQVCLHKDGCWYVHIQLKSETPKTQKTTNVIGVDFGRRDIAVTSTGQSWSGKEIQKTRDKYSRVRASLQNPAYTSQSCHCCLHIGVRTEKRFKCSNQVCGWIGDADDNGSKMIALLGLSVNQPRGSELLSCAIVQGLPKAPEESVSDSVGSLRQCDRIRFGKLSQSDRQPNIIP